MTARIEAFDGGFRLIGRVSFDNAEAVTQAGAGMLRDGVTRVDLESLDAPGSIAVAVLLAWYRDSHERGSVLVLDNAPRALERILDFTGLDEVLMAAPGALADADR